MGEDTKLHQRRHLTLDPYITSVLTTYRQARQSRAAAVGATLTDESFVFSPSANGATWRPPATLTRQYHQRDRRGLQEAGAGEITSQSYQT